MTFLRRLKKTKDLDFKKVIKIIDQRYGFGRLERTIASNWFNPFLTFWLNFRSLSLKEALRFPIFVYGRPRICGLSGHIIFKSKVKPGMIKFNYLLSGSPSLHTQQSELLNNGTIVFEESGMFCTGVKLFVKDKAQIEFGSNFKVADNVNIGCLKSIIVGAMARITHRCQIMDSNYHYVANFQKGFIPNCTNPIIIGNGCWIGNTSTVTGGVIMPDYTIVSNYSLVNKSINSIPSDSIIGGIPAKLISTGYRKVENLDLTSSIGKFYESNPDSVFIIPDGLEMSDCSKIR